ncbi:MAG: glycosyltransferase family 2 protein [Candidatus Omnitrophica bacterium]|nr:glycosyltransferase family 2 protein [Candidatus Omnitrophota bacterium]
MKTLVIIPAFNENVKLDAVAQRISRVLARQKQSGSIDILIMDDGSSSKDAEEIARHHHFHYLRNRDRKGVGYSIRRAYQFGVNQNYDILITMAGNNKDNPEEFDRLIEPITSDRADFVQGSRFLPGGQFGNMPLYRLITTRYVHPFLFSLVAGKRITDSTNGFRAIRASLLRDPKLQLDDPWLDHYELEPYLFCKAIHLGYRVVEVPVTKIYPDKKLGYSKMKPITGWWSILRTLIFIGLKIKK